MTKKKITKPKVTWEVGHHPGGRPTLYREEYPELIRKFFDINPSKVVLKDRMAAGGKMWQEEVEEMERFPTLAGFAASIGVGRENLWEWEKKHIEFSNAIKWCKSKQEEILVQNGLKGLVNSQFAILIARNLIGYQEKTTIEVQKSSHTQLLDAIEVQKGIGDGK